MMVIIMTNKLGMLDDDDKITAYTIDKKDDKYGMWEK